MDISPMTLKTGFLEISTKKHLEQYELLEQIYRYYSKSSNKVYLAFLCLLISS